VTQGLFAAVRWIGLVLTAMFTLFVDFAVLTSVASGELDWIDGFILALAATGGLSGGWSWLVSLLARGMPRSQDPPKPRRRQ
jgi:hypothetical protein